MATWLSSRDVSGFKCLFCLALLYGIMSGITYWITHMKHITPLGTEAPPYRFSEGRAVEHVRKLTEEIGGRQEGQPGLKEAAYYLKKEMEKLAERAGPDIKIEIDEALVEGTFSMVFLGRSMTFAYRDHINIAMRISSASSQDTDASVLVNGHFDSPLGSPGAGDCASCVASMLELARLVVDSSWVPPQPIIFLFNGAEELFLLGSHGFMKSHRWKDSVGAFINVEASGTGGPDLVCQSGPGSWPSRIYAQSAVYPMAHSAAQDIFPIIPGDTDYRIFAEDYGRIPGLDIIFVFGGYFYHTSKDTIQRLLPGSLQARGENLFSLIKAFSNSSELQNMQRRHNLAANWAKDERAIFFDYLSCFMILYSRREALVLHTLPILIFISMPFFLRFQDIGAHSYCSTFFHLVKGMLLHAAGIFLAIIVPALLAVLRLLFTGYGMNWFSHPYLAFFMYVPSSLVGLLIPRVIWNSFRSSRKEDLVDEAYFWGSFGFYACITLAYVAAGLSGGFLTFFISASMIPAWITFHAFVKLFGRGSLKSATGYVIPIIPCLTYSVYFGGIFVQFLIEKMGMMGSLPQTYGYFVPDIIVAAIIGVVTGWCVGPVLPIVGHWLARSRVVQLLLHLSVLALALASQFFPYSEAAPKRVVLQHTFFTSGANAILGSSYDVSVVDPNSLAFLFKHSPDAAKELQISPISLKTASYSNPSYWIALYPVPFLFTGSLKFPAAGDNVLEHYRSFPHLYSYLPSTVSASGFRKIYLDLYIGSLEEVWVAVLNITGPLSNWSFAGNKLPAPEVVKGAPPSYVCRLSGRSYDNWTFWLEANSSDPLRVDVAVLDQYLVNSSKKLKGLFPSWVDVTAYSSFLSSYLF
ncbi:hypothetical protein H6P81_012289 [Aristolochia fimbriata]|uniref:Peptidase M28 domain-containing protein n=1 Tax=Aristolochia fimbriata TaxID=158543 RepID=A0AAV7EEG6_ARIFI|nr:hypothetical protein H6P81_012289 [Aristolochia fimbriata]